MKRGRWIRPLSLIQLVSCGRCFFEARQHLFSVAFRLHPGKDPRDLAIAVNDKRGALDTHHFLAIHVFLFEDAESRDHFLFRISEQSVRQVVFVFELLLRLWCIGRNA